MSSENLIMTTKGSDDQLYWLKSYLLVFMIIVKAGVVPTKMDWNAMNLTRLYKERKKERRVKKDEEDEEKQNCFVTTLVLFHT